MECYLGHFCCEWILQTIASPYNRPLRPRGWVDVQPYPFMTSALRWGGWSAPGPTALPLGKTRYPLYRRLVRPQGRSGRVRKISLPTGIRSPDRPARSESYIPTELCRPIYYSTIRFIYIYVANRIVDTPSQSLFTTFYSKFPGVSEEYVKNK